MRTRAAGAFVAAAVLVLAGSTAAVAGQKVKYDSADYWSEQLSSEQLSVECTKMEFKGKETNTYTVSGDFVYVVVKGGPDTEISSPESGETLYGPVNNSGEPADISWVVTCEVPE